MAIAIEFFLSCSPSFFFYPGSIVSPFVLSSYLLLYYSPLLLRCDFYSVPCCCVLLCPCFSRCNIIFATPNVSPASPCATLSSSPLVYRASPSPASVVSLWFSIDRLLLGFILDHFSYDAAIAPSLVISCLGFFPSSVATTVFPSQAPSTSIQGGA